MSSEDQITDGDDTFDNPFKEEPGVTDLALIVEDKKIFVNKALLGMVSPVFKAMFESDFKEKHCSEVELPGKSFEDVVEFLRVIYPNVYKTLDFQTVIRVLPLMHEYSCLCQIKECQQFMIQNIKPDKKDVDIDILLQCMRLSDMCELQDVLNSCIKQGANHTSSLLTKNELFDKIPAHVKEKLYYKRLVMFENSSKALVTDICKQCESCKKRISFKQHGFLLDTPIRDSYMNNVLFEKRSTPYSEEEITFKYC